MDEKDLSMGEMLDMQTRLQDKYFEKWGGVNPDVGARKLLWLYGELAEAGDIIKKKGEKAIMEDEKTRADFIEEMCDALMYFGDVMLCFDIKAEDIRRAYTEKFERNMKRW